MMKRPRRSSTGERPGHLPRLPPLPPLRISIPLVLLLFAATLGSPVVKVAAFTYGVRTALSGSARSGRGTRGRRRRG